MTCVLFIDIMTCVSRTFYDFYKYRVGGPIMSHVNFKSFHSAMVVLLNFYILQG